MKKVQENNYEDWSSRKKTVADTSLTQCLSSNSAQGRKVVGGVSLKQNTWHVRNVRNVRMTSSVVCCERERSRSCKSCRVYERVVCVSRKCMFCVKHVCCAAPTFAFTRYLTFYIFSCALEWNLKIGFVARHAICCLGNDPNQCPNKHL